MASLALCRHIRGIDPHRCGFEPAPAKPAPRHCDRRRCMSASFPNDRSYCLGPARLSLWDGPACAGLGQAVVLAALRLWLIGDGGWDTRNGSWHFGEA